VPVTSPDFYPTLLEAAGLPPRPEQHVDGESILPLLEGGSELTRDAIYWHYPHYGNQGGSPGRALRAGDWKLIKFYTPGKDPELYNLADDLGEQNNLADKRPAMTQKLLAMLEAHLDETDSRLPTVNPKQAQ